jgi:hypothetical protein
MIINGLAGNPRDLPGLTTDVDIVTVLNSPISVLGHGSLK